MTEIIRVTIRDEKDKPKVRCEGCEDQYPSDFITDDGVHLCKYCFVSLLEDEIGELRKICLEFLKAPPSNVPARKKFAEFITGGVSPS